MITMSDNEYLVELGGNLAPDVLLLQALLVPGRPVLTVTLPNPITLAPWPPSHMGTLVTDVDVTEHHEIDGDIRLRNGDMLSEAGRIDPPDVWDGIADDPNQIYSL